MEELTNWLRAKGSQEVGCYDPPSLHKLDIADTAASLLLEVEQQYSVSYGLPVFYFTQLMALAFGVPADKLGFQKHFVSADGLLSAGSPA